MNAWARAVPVFALLACVACGDLGGWKEISYDVLAPEELATRRIHEPATGEGLTLVRAELEEGHRVCFSIVAPRWWCSIGGWPASSG